MLPTIGRAAFPAQFDLQPLSERYSAIADGRRNLVDCGRETAKTPFSVKLPKKRISWYILFGHGLIVLENDLAQDLSSFGFVDMETMLVPNR